MHSPDNISYRLYTSGDGLVGAMVGYADPTQNMRFNGAEMPGVGDEARVASIISATVIVARIVTVRQTEE